MPNPFFEPGETRAAKVNELFSTIAWRYDLLNDLQSLGLHRLWKRRLARLAGVGPAARALDLCCGTGDVTLALARTGAKTVGIDANEAMLALARQRAVRWISRIRGGEQPRLSFLQADALHVPFPDNSFDAVTISYGLRNLPDARAGLAEMWRVAKPGGRLLVLDFGKPNRAFWRRIFFAYLRRVVPWFGRRFCGRADAYAYILESLLHYEAQAGVALWLRQLPTARVRILDLLGGAMSIQYAEKSLTPPASTGP